MQAAFSAGEVQVTGRYHDFSRISDEVDRKEHVFHFCPDCGSQVFYTELSDPDLVVVSIGSFADPAFPPPTDSTYDSRRHPWIGLPESVQRLMPELWDSVHPLYEAGRYAEAADRGRELIEAYPGQGRLFYNVACCESILGRTDDAIDHLRQAIGVWEGCRELARHDADFDAIRNHPAFVELTAD
jgi:tetratricopeptide (TPR) repeat protein